MSDYSYKPSKIDKSGIRRYKLDKIYCKVCDCYHQERISKQHQQTRKHLRNILYPDRKHMKNKHVLYEGN